jgi:hypothetical protein
MRLLAALFEKRRPPGGGLESREETPKEGIRNASALRRNKILLRRTKRKASFAGKSSQLAIARREVTPPPWRPDRRGADQALILSTSEEPNFPERSYGVR